MEEALANRQVKIRYLGKTQNLDEFLWEVTGERCTDWHVPQYLRGLTKGYPQPLSPFAAQAALNDIRGFEMCRESQSPSGLTIENCDVINLAWAFADRYVAGIPIPAPWYSTFVHRVIILMAVIKNAHTSGDRAQALEQARGACRTFEPCLTSTGLGFRNGDDGRPPAIQ
ncbi:hypothetical protein JCM3774_000556 [Rhodotorula dairenensis]